MSESVAIVGAGIVGLTVAREVLHRRPSTSITVVEKERCSQVAPVMDSLAIPRRGY